ncbi:uncharacterized protein LOC126902010 [Daktulosphaira vitifoliae]|uniref:uncharacterized protein LOC126902010 n=1 Tax=Daktulosphaira vitifoliae TaxID=58002 RepID=UPI0021AA5055|nr:uncharacterized protein LOC126902010 [Daktulosphaira vitifoliae]
MYIALIHSNSALSKVQKFFYLKSSLNGIAANVVKSVELTEVNYDYAWSALINRYNNKKMLVQAHTKALYDIQPITKESSSKLRCLIDKIINNMNALETLGQDPKAWGSLLVHLITSKLDQKTLKEWETEAPKTVVPSVSTLMDFLETRFKILEAVESSCSSNDKSEKRSYENYGKGKAQEKKWQNKTVMHVATTKFKCYVCNEGHPIYRCTKFLSLSANERKEQTIKLNLCENCLTRHTSPCKAKGCRICNDKHNTLLHQDKETVHNSATALHSSGRYENQVLLSTAIVKIKDRANKTWYVRALLDSGSQSNFITTDLANGLGLSKRKVKVTIEGVNKSITQSQYSIVATIEANCTSYNKTIELLTLPKITTLLPSENINVIQEELPDNIKLADPSYAVPGKIDILIGAACFYEILLPGKYTTNNSSIIYQETELGWIVAGSLCKLSTPITNSFFAQSLSIEDKIDKQLTKFWEIEEIGDKRSLSEEEKLCVDHFNRTLGCSRGTAFRRFLSTEKRLTNNADLKKRYVEFMNEYEQLNHMSIISSDQDKIEEKNSYFMPHHAILRDDKCTTKTRIVFDASCITTNGKSLNDILLKGPVIQDDLMCILARFRTYKYAFSSDITKMYRQIIVAEQDRKWQKILWRSKPSEKIEEYHLNTLTYGTSHASYVATACLEKLANENENKYPLASLAIKEDFYMDDYLGGGNSIAEALMLRNDIIKIMNSAGFQLRKWMSNEPLLLSNIPNADNDPLIVLNLDGSTTKTLGLCWNPVNDVYLYKVNIERNDNEEASTKRNVLSTIATIFDPLGLIGPVIIAAKIIMQELWKLNVKWDEVLPSAIKAEWELYRASLSSIEHMTIPRLVVDCDNVEAIQIHGFSDASVRAYGACLYLRVYDRSGSCATRLVTAKSRVAPLKVLSLARLELCAAVLLVRLFKKIVPRLRLSINKKYFWTDSTIVLSWINAPSSRWKTFVANRVGEIHEATSKSEWYHVKSEDNPADIISRGCNPEDLRKNQLWWNGPPWINLEENQWPLAEVPKQDETVSTVRPGYHLASGCF